jgi:predicted acylesterase/phospholipase RssA
LEPSGHGRKIDIEQVDGQVQTASRAARPLLPRRHAALANRARTAVWVSEFRFREDSMLMEANGRRKRIGLALSGGGFRATLFHLGVVRFLRDADILRSVTHITSVSGGSVLAAHLALNWDRYVGTEDQFDAVAAEVVRFVRMDVRNRIVRRAPLALPIHLARWLMRMGTDRRLTRTGMLEVYYERFLYGDTCLFQLPEHPQLHILSTNLTEGSLCSFTREGVIFQKRMPGELFRFERLHAGLATVPLAVTASSAFPGFFPPLQIDGRDVGAVAGQFNRQVFTDGGVFDNLGVRMFRNIERTWIGKEAALTLDDVYDVGCVAQALKSAAGVQATTPFGRISQMYHEARGGGGSNGGSDGGPQEQAVVGPLCSVISQAALYREPAFQAIQPDDPEAASLLESVRLSGKDPEHHDRIWLNRQIVETVLRQVTGQRCLRPMTSMFDQVLVSDAGKHLQARTEVGSAGLIATAMRASDIGMDRVWQLEKETFGNQPGFLFMPMTHVVPRHEDATAPHPEIQRRMPDIRTDLDAFSALEVSALVRHGYCVARSVCRRRPELFGGDPPRAPPWDPSEQPGGAAQAARLRPLALLDRHRGPTDEVITARLLRHSAERRVWSRLFNYRDWASYLYLLILIPLLSIGPALIYRAWSEHTEAKKTRQTIAAIARSGQDQQVVAEMVSRRPTAAWGPLKYEEVSHFEPLSNEGFTFTSDTLIFDLRQSAGQVPTDDGETAGADTALLRRRIRFHKNDDYDGQTFRFHLGVPTATADARCLNARLNPVLSRLKSSSANRQGLRSRWELRLDVSKVPVETPVDVYLEVFMRGRFDGDFHSDPHEMAVVEVPAGMLSMWLLLPEKRPFDRYRLLELDPTDPDYVKLIRPSEGVEDAGGTIIYWSLLSPRVDRRYECHWTWRE